MGCLAQVILTIIAFAIHPILGIIWLIAQAVGSLNDDDDRHT